MRDTKPTDYEIEFCTFHAAEAHSTEPTKIAAMIRDAANTCLETRDMTSEQAKRFLALADDYDFIRFIRNELMLAERDAAEWKAEIRDAAKRKAAKQEQDAWRRDNEMQENSRAGKAVKLCKAGEITALDLESRLRHIEQWAAQEVADAATDQYAHNWKLEQDAAIIVLDGTWLAEKVAQEMQRANRVSVNEYYEKACQPVCEAVDLSPEDRLPDNFYIDDGIGADCKKLIDEAASLHHWVCDADFPTTEVFDAVYYQMVVWYRG